MGDDEATEGSTEEAVDVSGAYDKASDPTNPTERVDARNKPSAADDLEHRVPAVADPRVAPMVALSSVGLVVIAILLAILLFR